MPYDKHTPGPWTAHKDGWITKPATVTSLAGNVALVTDPTHLQAQADARLIAAAPELLNAVLLLLGCTDLCVDELDPTSEEAIDAAQDALAKVAGTKVFPPIEQRQTPADKLRFILEILRELGFGTDNKINGSVCVDTCGDMYEDLTEYLTHTKGA